MTDTELRLESSRPEIAALPSMMLLVMGAVLGIVAAWTFLTPRRYTSDMILLVQNARDTEAVTSGQGGNASTITDVSEEQLNSEISVLNSADVANTVIDPDWNQHSTDAMTREQIEVQERAVHSLRSRLEVSGIRGSHAIDVRMTASSPESARHDLEVFLQAFLRKQRDLATLPGASELFSEKAVDSARNLESARKDLANYESQTGYVSLQDQESALQTKLLATQFAERDTDAELAEIQRRASAEHAQLGSIPQRLPTVQVSSPATGTVDPVNLVLLNLENRRFELLTKYNADDRLVTEVDQQISQTKEMLGRASEVSSRETSSDINPLWSTTQRDLSTNSVALAGLRAKQESLASQADRLRSQLSNTELGSGQYQLLTERVTELENQYKAYAAKRDAARMNDLMDQQKWLNIAVIQYPTMSLIPSHPQKVMSLILGTLCAGLLGGCTVFFFEGSRQRIGTREELQSFLPYPVLASIPFSPLDSEPKANRGRQIAPSGATKPFGESTPGCYSKSGVQL